MPAVIDGISSFIKETFSPQIRESLVGIDPFMGDFLENNVSATSEGMGRDYYVLHTIVTSLAGAIKATGAPLGDTLALDGNPYNGASPTTARSITYAASSLSTFPSIGDFVGPGSIVRKVQLRGWQGSMYLPIDLKRASSLTAAIADSVRINVEQTAKNVAMQRANSFMSPEYTHRALDTLSGSISGGTTSHTYVTFTATRPRAFAPGMMVDIHDATGGWALVHNGGFVVRSVNPWTGAVTLDTANAATISTANVAAGDVVCLRGSRGNGPFGLFYWLTNTGTVFNIDLTVDTVYQSMVINNLGTALTDSKLREYFGGFISRMDLDKLPDLLLTTQGVINGWLAEVDDMKRWMPTGGASDRGNKGEYMFNYDSRSYPIRACTLMPSGWLAAFKSKNNIIRYTVPRIRGTGTEGEFSNEVEFIAPLLGSTSIWMPTRTSTGAVTRMMQAPFEIVENYAPEVMQGILIKGITEIVSYS